MWKVPFQCLNNSIWHLSNFLIDPLLDVLLMASVVNIISLVGSSILTTGLLVRLNFSQTFFVGSSPKWIWQSIFFSLVNSSVNSVYLAKYHLQKLTYLKKNSSSFFYFLVPMLSLFFLCVFNLVALPPLTWITQKCYFSAVVYTFFCLFLFPYLLIFSI